MVGLAMLRLLNFHHRLIVVMNLLVNHEVYDDKLSNLV